MAHQFVNDVQATADDQCEQFVTRRSDDFAECYLGLRTQPRFAMARPCLRAAFFAERPTVPGRRLATASAADRNRRTERAMSKSDEPWAISIRKSELVL